MNFWFSELNRIGEVWGEAMLHACWQGGVALLLVWGRIPLVEKLLQEPRKRIALGIVPPDHAISLQRELLKLKRELLSVDRQ